MTAANGTAEARRRAGRAVTVSLAAGTLGFLVSTQLLAQADRSPFVTRYQVTLAEVVSDLSQEQADLRAQVASLREALYAIQRDGARLDSAAAALQPDIAALRQAAGLTEERGPGVVVTLDDARVAPNTGGIELAIVHASDLTDVFNAAWAAGARAISVNGERIVATSSCVGATIQINGVLMSPPFEIVVLGPPDHLMAELMNGPGLADLHRRHTSFGLGLEMTRSSELTVGPFTGPTRVRYATPRP